MNRVENLLVKCAMHVGWLQFLIYSIVLCLLFNELVCVVYERSSTVPFR